MKVCVIGTGYVGLVAGTCIAEMGNDVICVDNDEQKIANLQKGIIQIYEPSLEDLIKDNVSEGRLRFSSSIEDAVTNSLVCFIAVGTPQDEDGSADISHVLNVAEDIAKSMDDYKVIVNKSTVPVGVADKIKEIVKKNTDFDFDVVSNPEFLKQGAAVEDFMHPDRIILGVENEKSKKIMLELYSAFVKNQNPIITMDTKSAEMVKYASNSFLALKISYINEIANICENLGADINCVRKGMCTDSRIGSKFLYPGIGYGGSCFPKDVKALIKVAEDNNISNNVLVAVDKTNMLQKQNFVNKIVNRFEGNVAGMNFAVWGLAFKPKTNDMREAPSITIINELLRLGANVTAYDPKAYDNAKRIFGDKIQYAKSSYDALENADCLLLLTEWNEFRNPDFVEIKHLMKAPIIFDGRNQYDSENLCKMGFEYHCIGMRINR